MLLPALMLTAALAAPTMSTDRECYAAGQDTITITGSGFAPSSPVTLQFTGNDEILTSDATSDATGALDTEVTAPDLKDFNADSSAIPVALDTADGATAGFDLTAWDGTLTGYRSTIRRGQRLRFETTGWTGADELFLHYVRGGKTVFTQRLGATSGPCGDLTKSFKAFTFRGAKLGSYNLRISPNEEFTNEDRWFGFKRTRLVS
ncbi:hypothetical protein [Solirubrobacter soli]|uniref:hypothetical protein n=1 Tax=Solirubrobacter soli TaxID=363832 RepID=UPI000408ABB2|nr:hypothetical protein [Solirubrobacter soli]